MYEARSAVSSQLAKPKGSECQDLCGGIIEELSTLAHSLDGFLRPAQPMTDNVKEPESYSPLMQQLTRIHDRIRDLNDRIQP